MNDKIKEILDFKEDENFKRLSVDEIVLLRYYISKLESKIKDYELFDNEKIEGLHNIINDVKDLIVHELNCHILKNDEETWNLEYYTNGKLDYRKLLIGLLTDINSRLGGKND